MLNFFEANGIKYLTWLQNLVHNNCTQLTHQCNLEYCTMVPGDSFAKKHSIVKLTRSEIK